MADFSDLLSQAKKMQEKMKQTQEALKNIEIEGTSGADSVRIVMNGDGEIKKIHLDDKLLKETKEIIEDGNTGLLVPNRSSDEIVKKIIYLLEHTNNSAQIANNGQRFLIENINYTKMINSYIDLYYRKNESLN